MIEDELFEEIVALRRDLHRHPETGFDVQRTAGIVAAELRKAGLSVREGVGKSGVVADLLVPGGGPLIAFRADMDALPMDEENQLPYRSTVSGKAHMCGHDGHTAMLVGAAKALAKQKLNRSVRFIFQPSEEQKPGGAPGMIADGCLDNVSEIYGLHVWPWLPTGTVGICPGAMLAQSDLFEITIRGRGGHAAAPHLNCDPIVIGAQLVSALQSIVSRMTDPLEAAVISVTQFKAGSAFNVIPSEAYLAGTVRTFEPGCLQTVQRSMKSMVEHIAAASGAEASFNYQSGYPPLINHQEACSKAAAAAGKFLERDAIHLTAKPAMFGEDFAYYLQHVPGCFIQLGCRNEQKECVYALHHPRFNLDEECMRVGTRLFQSLV